MKNLMLVAIAALVPMSAAHAVVVTAPTSGPQWLGYMNVFELPANGGGFVFGSPWGTADLNSSFDDANLRITMSPNTIGDPNPFWYQGGGAPGNPGNKSMEANLYIEVGDIYNGQTVTFNGTIISTSVTSAHVARIFIRDFASDFSSSNDIFVPVTAGAFSVSLNTLVGAGRHLQYGFQMKGENVWFTDTAPFGNVVIGTVPAPASAGLLALGGLFVARRRR